MRPNPCDESTAARERGAVFSCLAALRPLLAPALLATGNAEVSAAVARFAFVNPPAKQRAVRFARRLAARGVPAAALHRGRALERDGSVDETTVEAALALLDLEDQTCAQVTVPGPDRGDGCSHAVAPPPSLTFPCLVSYRGSLRPANSCACLRTTPCACCPLRGLWWLPTCCLALFASHGSSRSPQWVVQSVCFNRPITTMRSELPENPAPLLHAHAPLRHNS